MSSSPSGHLSAGERLFGRLARAIIRHPRYVILFWVVLFLIAVPFLPLVGSVTTNSTESVPSNSSSAMASAELAHLFPNQTGGSSSILLFASANMTNASASAVIESVTAALQADHSLQNVAGIESVYTSYAAYLAGQVRLAAGAILGEALSGPDPLPLVANSTAALFWGPPAQFLGAWENLSAGHSGNASQYNFPAYEATRAGLANDTEALTVLGAFYSGYSGSPAGFNGSAACAADPATVLRCANEVALEQESPLVPDLVLDLSGQAVARAVLDTMGISNYTEWPTVQYSVAVVIGVEVGFPGSWVADVWAGFPSGVANATTAGAFANATVSRAGSLWTQPLPVPHGIWAQYVDPSGTASLVMVDFAVADSYTNASGGTPVYADLPLIDQTVQDRLGLLEQGPTPVLDFPLSYYQTGAAPLDQLTNSVVNASLELVLPLTVGLLLVIAMLYFRSPVTPSVTFAGLGIALLLAIGGTVLLGKLFGAVDTTSLTLEEVFVLGVGTDYSIFLVARYREELLRGRSSEEAIEQSLTWAGQSIATSGSTAIIATLALTFSGVALLSQWGRVLSLAILITILLSLTFVPACLRLIGPRIFWPDSGERFRQRAAHANARLRSERTYFYRVGRLTQRRPVAVLGILLLISIPLLYIAFQVPLAYDFYGQLPAGHPASDGLQVLYTHFGNGSATPSFALVTFAAPLVIGNQTNATEFSELAALTSIAQNTSGIALVESPIGPYGASLATWENLSLLPTVPRQNLLGTWAGFVGTDGRTVLLSLQPFSTGLSSEAVSAVRAVQSNFEGYQSTHPDVTGLAFGGGAPTIGDLADETNTATLLLIVAVTIGLLVVLLAVIRSWIIAVMAIATIGLSISWAWAVTYLVFQELLGFPLFFYVRTILFLLILGLGIDYNIFLLTRVREERVKGATSSEAIVTAVGRTGGIITAAAIILASAFGALVVGEFTLIRAIGFSVAVAVILDAMVVRTFLVPSALQILKDRAWSMLGRKGPTAPPVPARSAAPSAGDPGR